MGIIGAEKTREYKGMTLRQKSRMFGAMENATIRDGRIIAEDGVDVSHRLEIRPRKTEGQKFYAENREAMGKFATENGGYVTALIEPSKLITDRFPSLTQADSARLVFIGTYTNYDGVLRYDNGRNILRPKLFELLGMSRQRFSEFFNKIIDEGILLDEGDRLVVNPNVFQRGKIGQEFEDYKRIRIYRETVRKLYKEYGKGRNARQLAIVFMILPFLHYNLNIVCYNPSEHYYDSIKPMTLDKMAALLGYSESRKLKAAMNRVKLDNQPVFGFVEDVHDRRKQRIIVNPRVVFAGNAKGLEQVRALCVLFN